MFRRLTRAPLLLWRAWRIGRAALFDAAWYRARHGVVAWPALHYLRHGAEAGCEPGPGFDGAAYLLAYADVDLLGINPFWHYVTEGEAQGRAVFPVRPAAWAPPVPLAWADADGADADGADADEGGPPPPPDGVLVSVIIPSRDRAGLLGRCVAGLLRHPSRVELEILIVDHASRTWRARRLLRRLAADKRVRVLRHDGAFNWSAMNNAAAQQARGEVLLLLNNDTADPCPGALDALAAAALRPEAGAVGALLLYPGGRIQHAGISLGRRARAVHLFRGAMADAPGVPRAPREVAAVTGACLAIRRALFLAVGGLDEAMAVAGSDIDLCLRVRSRGLAVVLAPGARMTHAEGRTRGDDAAPARRARLAWERRLLLARWGALAASDPTLPVGTLILRGRPMMPAAGRLDAPAAATQPDPTHPECAARNDRTPRPAFP